MKIIVAVIACLMGVGCRAPEVPLAVGVDGWAKNGVAFVNRRGVEFWIPYANSVTMKDGMLEIGNSLDGSTIELHGNEYLSYRACNSPVTDKNVSVFTVDGSN